MTPARFHEIASRYPRLRVAVIGDVCLDRYLEIDPAKAEKSIETGLPVFNVTRVRSQPGGAGTIINNLAALGVGEIIPVAFCGEDGEGWELARALAQRPGVSLKHFLRTGERRTFTYTKPLMMPARRSGRRKEADTPRELNRLDFKNWTPTPATVEDRIIHSVQSLARRADAFILLDQVDAANTGVLTGRVLKAIGGIASREPGLFVLGDSRRGFRHFPPVAFKMNAQELAKATNQAAIGSVKRICQRAASIASQTGRHVFVTLAERGIVGAAPDGHTEHAPALPVRGQIDIVGAGDAVTANLVTSLLAGASLRESLEIANAAASIVIHQVGTTGTASREELGKLLA